MDKGRRGGFIMKTEKIETVAGDIVRIQVGRREITTIVHMNNNKVFPVKSDTSTAGPVFTEHQHTDHIISAAWCNP